ncbi:hypothetical protein FA15DRAFT_672999 [Coprinopsis marcescibilis]|uniref:MYND-type domain-containing protein n=1 Tax=Coprinopsis marcescibilis TaxID=230819 RepID=A0A5C3KL19_COPMA|nr:hypothetical protein FA15DRAFT_672999 [Coprinopsis marcescibilis]
MSDPGSSTTETQVVEAPKKPMKEVHFKGESRLLKVCHWCYEKQKPGVKPYQACGQCKEVIYCSKACQRASWPFHKTSCRLNAETLKSGQISDPVMAQLIATFKRWHTGHLEVFKHAAICALDLGRNPANLENGYLFIQIKPKDDIDQLPMKRKFRVVTGIVLTEAEAGKILDRFVGDGGKPIFDSSKEESEFLKKKGGLGICTVIMIMQNLWEVVKIILPTPRDTTLRQMLNNWGDDWVWHLSAAVDVV